MKISESSYASQMFRQQMPRHQLFAYHDKRKRGRRIALKSHGDDTRSVWVSVLMSLRSRGIRGWKLYKGKSWWGGNVYGITKHTDGNLPTMTVR